MSRWPFYDEEQIEDAVAVLRSGKVNAWTGAKVAEFEKAYADYLGRRHAIAVANGTVALDLVLMAIGIKTGDEVVVTPRSFVASASCVPMAGGIPVFADVDPVSQALTADSIAAVLTPRTKAVIVVHLGGWPADMPAIMRLAKERRILVIEDCAQAHGASIAGRSVGSFGDIAAFSFCQDKIISTGGEGGLIALDDESIWANAWSLKDHGKNYDAVTGKTPSQGFRWVHDSFGSNYRMTELQAALGLRQLGRLSETNAIRTANAHILLEATEPLVGLRTPRPSPDLRHAWYRFYTFVRPERLKTGWSRDRILAELNRRGISCFAGSCSEIYREHAFSSRNLGPPQRLPVAAELGETSLAFLVDPCQDGETMRRAAAELSDVMRTAESDVHAEAETESA